MLNRIFCSNHKSFTLIEVVVAVFVLTIGVLAVFNVVQNITVYSRISSSRLTAVYLAQEGIELVRNQRDSNWLAGDSWDSNLPSVTESDILDRFDRVTTNTPEGDDKIKVSVEVSWEEKGKHHSVTAQTELYNWK